MKKGTSILVFLAAAGTGCTSDEATTASDAGQPDSSKPAAGGAGQLDSSKPGAGGMADATPGDAAQAKPDRSHLKDASTSSSLDYGDPAAWICLPGSAGDECRDDIDATEILKDKSQKASKHVPATDPEFDCFYVYPTVDLTGKGNTTDFSDISLILDPLLGQAAPFTRICKVYAPLYRQQSLSAAAGADASVNGLVGDEAVANRDVEGAFQYYLDHYNKGRRFVLIGHSQGSLRLTAVLSKFIDGDAPRRAQLISALLIGALDKTLYAPSGKDVGGTFKNVPFCTSAGQVGCIIAYNSFSKDAPPPANSVFGHAPAGSVNACTNPAVLAGNTGRYQGSYFATKLNQLVFTPDLPKNTPPTVTTPFLLVRDMFSGKCVDAGGVNYLEVSADQTADDQRVVPPYRISLVEGLGLGTHVDDFALEEDDLIAAVEKQASSAH